MFVFYSCHPSHVATVIEIGLIEIYCNQSDI
jgi:hypothetical protein